MVNAQEKLLADVRRVQEIKLAGAPTTVYYSESFYPTLKEKIDRLIEEGTQFFPISSSIISNTLDNNAIAILTQDHEAPEQIYHWHVDNEDAADLILGLYGTGLVQEKAGAAFRATSKGESIPVEHPYDKDSILGGITSTVTAKPQPVEYLRSPGIINLDRDSWSIIGNAYPVVEAAFDSNGAIAAAIPPESAGEPNYAFFWQRDAGQVAITLSALEKATASTALKNKIRLQLKSYFEFISNLSIRKWINRVDLGTGRYSLTGIPVKDYGNPQNDGPAITALAIMEAIEDPKEAHSLAKPYLNYLTSNKGSGLTFDLWELSVGNFFYTDNLARKALRRGGRIAEQSNDIRSAETYLNSELVLINRLNKYYHPHKRYFFSGRRHAIPWMEAISNLDISVIGSILTAFDINDHLINVDSPPVKDTMQKIESAFRKRWTVNRTWYNTDEAGTGLGRFPEDTNDGVGSTGGNPWTIATLWAAQYYYRLAERYDHLTLSNEGEFARQPLIEMGDGYLKYILAHLPPMALTEQIDRQTGKPRGARNLTWAHAELINTLLIRNQIKKTPAV